MRMLRSFVVASIALCATGALAGTFPSPPLYPSFSSAREQIIKIDPPGAVSSTAVAINAKGDVAGYYTDQTEETYGFIRKANGAFLMLAAGTAISDMNEAGDVTGNSVSGAFMRKANGKITTFGVPNAAATDPEVINNNGEIAGNFLAEDDSYHGFLRAKNGKITTFDPPGSNCNNDGLGTSVYGLNSAGTIIGQACIFNVMHNFVRDSRGHFTTIDPPGSVSSTTTAINASGAIAGSFGGSDGVGHGYIRDPSGSFTIVNAPRPAKQQGVTIAGLNNAGATVGTFINAQCFIRSASGVFTKLKVPGAVNTTEGFSTYPTSINDRRQVVGYYFTSEFGPQHAFLRTQ
jgi:hypothetical protein